MLRSGFGSKSSKSLSSMQGGISTPSDRAGGPDKVIRSLGGSDIKGWYDSTDIRLSAIANDSDVTTWHDKGPDGQNLTQATAGNKPHYIHSGLNGRPVLRSDGSDDEMLTTTSVDWSSTTSAFVLYKATTEANAGPFGGLNPAGGAPKVRFGIAAYSSTDPDRVRTEVLGAGSGDGGGNFQIDHYYETTGSASDTPPAMPSVKGAFMLSYYEWQINSGESGADAFTLKSYNKDAVSEIGATLVVDGSPTKIATSDANTLASSGFSTQKMQVFRNIHSPGYLTGDIAYIIFSNRHYSLGERQRISKAIQQIYGFSNIN
jgi:hypothetical protein